MRYRMAFTAALAAAVVTALAAAPAVPRMQPQRDKSQRPSPPGHADCKFASGATITVDYSSPRMKGRKIFGELVPFGQVWRAGANEATTFVPSAPVRVGGLDVAAGSYTLFAIPNQGKPWTLIVSKKTGEWGIPYPGEQLDLGRTEMSVSTLAAPVENFAIKLSPDGGGFLLQMEWETTQASVKITERK